MLYSIPTDHVGIVGSVGMVGNTCSAPTLTGGRSVRCGHRGGESGSGTDVAGHPQFRRRARGRLRKSRRPCRFPFEASCPEVVLPPQGRTLARGSRAAPTGGALRAPTTAAPAERPA